MKKCLLLILISFYSNASDSLKIKKEFLVLHKDIMIKPMEVERKADSLLKVCQKMNWQNGMAEATYYLAASQLYNFKNTKKIKKLFDVAEKLNSNPDLQIQILLAKSYSNILEGTYQEAFSLSIQAFTLANNIKANHHLYRIFINLGNVYTNLDNHEKALEYFEKAYLQTNNETSDEQNIVLFNNINIVLSKKMDSKKAGFYRDKMLKILDSNQEIKYKYGQMCYIGIAYNYILLRQLDNAEYYLSLVENLQKGKDPNYITAYYLTNLGYIQICKKKFEEAELNLKQSIDLSIQFKDNYIRYRTYQILANLYFSKGNYESGLTFQEKSFALRDSITSLDHQKFIANAETKYKTAEKEAKLKEAQFEISQKRNWIIGLSLGFLGIMVTGGLLWRISSIKTKAEETEKLKNLEIENQKKLLSAKEIERQRIAKELHDSVGSQLTVVSTSLDNAFYLFENQKLNPEKLENISGEVRLAAQSLRDTIWATYNSEISVLELKSRIQEFINKFGDQNIFKVEMDISGDEIILTPIEGLNLFRIVQESLNNIQKHANASLVQIKGKFENDKYKLEISDNGQGFDLEKGKENQSYGLNNMKVRAEEIEGEIDIKAKKGKGTVVKVQKIAK